jgi:hypothetical protein
VVNQHLRWTDETLLSIGTTVKLSLGYNGQDFEQLFVGEIVSVQATFPADGQPMLSIAAQDGFERLREAKKSRWFVAPIPLIGNVALPDLAVGSIVSLENGFIPVFDPVGAAISILLAGASAAVAVNDADELQKLVRRQEGESDLAFLEMIAAENGWELMVDHTGPTGGHKLRFFSALGELEPTRTYNYGTSLIDWTPRITDVGIIASVSAYVRVSVIKTVFEVTLGYNWDSAALEIDIRPALLGAMPSGSGGRNLVLDENLSPISGPRRLMSTLIPSLNERITGSGSVVGDPALTAGRVVQLEDLGREFGGRYRITNATHRIDTGGYRTTFEGRKEIWFGSIPALDQGAVELEAPFVAVGVGVSA